MRVTLSLIALVVACAVLGAQPRDAHTVRVQIVHHQTHDFRDVQFFELVLPQGRAAISVDGDLEFARVLRQMAGTSRVMLTLAPEAEAETLKR